MLPDRVSNPGPLVLESDMLLSLSRELKESGAGVLSLMPYFHILTSLSFGSLVS